jgi:hypothetical protein
MLPIASSSSVEHTRLDTLRSITKHSREENGRTMNNQEIETHFSMKKIEDPDVVPGSNSGQSGRPQRRGPKTAAGKARVGLNALTHGIASARLVVPGESPTEWELSRQGIVDALGPAGPVELALAERVATTLWRLRRVAAYETAAIAERQHLATASARLLPHPLDIDKVIRFEAHLNRQVYQALHQLEAMRAERRGQPTPLLRVDVQHHPGTPEAVDGSTG